METLDPQEPNGAAELSTEENGSLIRDSPENPVPEGMLHHHAGESLGEWLKNDLEKTKEDLHLGHYNRENSS